MQTVRILIQYLLLLLMAYTNSRGQSDNVVTSHFTSENGLPQNSINDIVFDRAGYCWLATEMGLVRFDGKNFKIYNSTDIAGLMSNRIERVCADYAGRVYVKSVSNQVYWINDQDRKMAPTIAPLDTHRIVIGKIGYAITEPHLVKKIDSLRKAIAGAHEIVEVGMLENEVYVYSDAELYYLSSNLGKVSIKSTPVDRGALFSSIEDKYMLQVYPGNRVMLWKNGNLVKGIKQIGGALYNDTDFRPDTYKIASCSNGTFISKAGQLYELMYKNNRLTSIERFSQLNIPGFKSIAYLKGEKKFFIGSNSNGLYLAKPSDFLYPEIPKEIGELNFYSQVFIDSNKIFARDAILSVSGKSSYIPLQTRHSRALYLDDSKSMYYESDMDLYKYNLASRRSKVISRLDSRLRAFSENKKDSTYIYTTTFSIGLLKNDKVIDEKKLPDGGQVISVFKGTGDTLLLACENGLKWYGFHENKYYKVLLDQTSVRSVLPDGKRLWIATYTKGFFLYENEILYPMPMGPKKALSTVHEFIEDRRGHFWLPTNDGLYKVLKSDLVEYAKGKRGEVSFFKFDKQNGLRTNEFNGGCFPGHLWLRDSLLSLPSLLGIVWFYPNQINAVYPDKGIYLDNISLDGNNLLWDKGQIEIPADFNSMTFQVSSPFFGNQENMRLEYIIEGLIVDWIPVPANGLIRIDGARAGKYVVIVRNPEYLRNNPEGWMKISIKVNPYFYNTIWFYLLLGCIMILGAYLFSLHRLRSLERQARFLSEQVQIRTQELHQAVEELGQSEANLIKSNRFKDKVIAMVLHDLRSPIRFISTLTSKLMDNHTMYDSEVLKMKLEELVEGAREVDMFTEKFFMWAKVQHEDFAINITRFPLATLFADVKKLYGNILRLKNNTLEISHTELVCTTDYHILLFIMRNLIDNANKNTANGYIRIDSEMKNTRTLILISDTGKGMDAAEIAHFFQLDRKGGAEGIGSVLVMKMLKAIKGELDIRSNPGMGSKFLIILPDHSQFETGGQASPAL